MTLADMPDMSEFGYKLLLQDVAVIWFFVKKSQQGVLWRMGTGMTRFFKHIYSLGEYIRKIAFAQFDTISCTSEAVRF